MSLPARPARRVLLAWELGEGMGHAARLLSIAERLRDEGWSPVVAARNPDALAARYAVGRVPLIAAPPHRNCFAGPGRFRAASYADMMGVCGYADERQLAAMVAAWDTVLREQDPALVIADYSPLLSLAAFGRTPLIAIGDGFVTPHGLPDGSFPSFGNGAPPLWDPAALLKAAQNVQSARGLPKPANLPQIVEGMGQVVSVPPELDIHGATRSALAAGPWEVLPQLEPPEAPHIFAYLHLSHPPARMVLRVLEERRMPGECYLPGVTDGIAAKLEGVGIKVHASPPPLRGVLGRASLLIHHGGIGSLEEAALAGRPQLLLPRHLEQSLNARRATVSLQGIFGLRDGATIEQIRQRLPSLLHDMQPMRAAQAAASRLAARPESAWHSLQRLLARLA